MKQFVYRSIFIMCGAAVISWGSQAQALDSSAAGRAFSKEEVHPQNGLSGKSGSGGLHEGTGKNQARALPPPMNFELSGLVEAVSPGLMQIAINGQTFDIAQNVTVYNLVDRSSTASIKVGAMVGYEANQLIDGSFQIVTLWVLNSPQ